MHNSDFAFTKKHRDLKVPHQLHAFIMVSDNHNILP